MRFSLWPTTGQPLDEILALARHAEATGWDGVWVADHFMPFAGDVGGPMHECFTLMTAIAATVPRVRVGSIVLGNAYRHPAVVAKQAITLDHVSGGRFVLGLGAGWQENEHQAYGITLPAVKERLDRFEEACEVITSLLTNARTTFAGAHYTITDAPAEPKPFTGKLPVLVGGGGEKRTLRIAARFADEWNVWGTPETLAAKGSILDAHCNDLGRDPATISRSAQALLFLSTDTAWLERFRGMEMGMPTIVGTPSEVVDIVGAYHDAGVSELLVPDFNLGDPARKRDTADLFITEVASHFR